MIGRVARRWYAWLRCQGSFFLGLGLRSLIAAFKRFEPSFDLCPGFLQPLLAVAVDIQYLLQPLNRT